MLKTEEDEFESYGKLVASKLRKISAADRKSSLKLQSEINSRIMEVELTMLE